MRNTIFSYTSDLMNSFMALFICFVERRMLTRHERQAYWTESERRDGHGDHAELEDRQSYRQRYMTGKNREKKEKNISSSLITNCAIHPRTQ